MSFSNKIVLITGAGSGIGEAIAVNFAKLRATLSLIDINSENIYKVAERCKKLSEASVLQSVIDVSKDKDLKHAVNKTIEEYGKIDVVVNCAGVYVDKGILDFDLVSGFDKAINVNLRAMVTMIHYTTTALIESKGCVINIASVAAHMVTKNAIPYNVSKAGVLQLTKSAALEFAAKGVRVNSISPGPVLTNIFLNAGKSEEELNIYRKKVFSLVPLRRDVPAEDIAYMVGYLASDKAKCITGADFVIDSGLTLAGSY